MYSEKKPYVTYGGAAIGFAYTSGRLAGRVPCTRLGVNVEKQA